MRENLKLLLRFSLCIMHVSIVLLTETVFIKTIITTFNCIIGPLSLLYVFYVYLYYIYKIVTEE